MNVHRAAMSHSMANPVGRYGQPAEIYCTAHYSNSQIWHCTLQQYRDMASWAICHRDITVRP